MKTRKRPAADYWPDYNLFTFRNLVAPALVGAAIVIVPIFLLWLVGALME